MTKGKMLTASERANVVKPLKMKKSTLKIFKIIKQDHRTVKRFTNEGKVDRKQHKSGLPRVTTSRDLRKIKRAMSQNPQCTDIFDAAGVTDVSKRTRNRILNNMADQRSPAVCPLLSDINCQKRLFWATKYLKTDFRTFIWTDEARATLDGPDGWRGDWLQKNTSPLLRYKRQQGGGGMMIWAGIIGDEIVGPFLVLDGLKVNSAHCCLLLEENFMPWLNSRNNDVKQSIIFQ